MTDEQIIKALDRCFTRGFNESTCYECPFYTATAKCTEDLRDSALDLINRQKEKIKEFDRKIVIQRGMIDYQKAEIERMEKELTEYKLRLKMSECTVDEIKSEAIKDFAERLKDKLQGMGTNTTYGKFKYGIVKSYEIDNLLKEMEGKAW